MNLTIQQQEQKILATIISCKKVMNGKDSDVSMDVMLFESVSGAYGQISQEIIEEENEIKFENFQVLGDNKFAYLKTVKNYVYGQDNENILRPLNENLQFDPFKEQLDKLILELENDNAFKVLDMLDKQILQTKIFAKKPISVLGFNIMETIKALDNSPDLAGVFSIMYNKNTKFIYFIRKGQVLAYDIKTNGYNILSNDKLTELNYNQVISQEITSNVVEIYTNIEITLPKLKEGFTDNLFNDKKRTQELKQYQTDIRFLQY